MAYSAGPVEYTVCISAETPHTPNECPRYGIKPSDGEVLGNAEYSFITIARRSTLTGSGSI